ncbi:MAG: ATP synthase F0 subunit B [Epulopiscium sp. Nele67-Bin005]|nr:MAG: ATP synthase F0 subunit B [Epulopiscium sp. Nele67-Bin005]
MLALFIIILILRKLLFQPVTDFIEKRKAAIAEEVNSAANAKSSAEKLQADYEEKLKYINREADTILKESRQKALAREAEIVEAAKVEAEAIKQKAKQDIIMEQDKAKAQIKTEMIEVASLMASKFVNASIDDAQQNQLITEIIDEMGDVQWLN